MEVPAAVVVQVPDEGEEQGMIFMGKPVAKKTGLCFFSWGHKTKLAMLREVNC